MRPVSFALAVLLMFTTLQAEALQCPKDKRTSHVYIRLPECLDAQPKSISVVIDNKLRIAERVGMSHEWEVTGKDAEFCILEVKLNSLKLPGYCTAVNVTAREETVGVSAVAAIDVPCVPLWRLKVITDEKRKPAPTQAPQFSFTVTRAGPFVCERPPDRENETTPVYMMLAEPDEVVVSVEKDLEVTVTRKNLEANSDDVTFGALYKPQVTQKSASGSNKLQYEFKRKQASEVPIRFIAQPAGTGATESQP
jgi:hypothetical protein